MDGGQGESSIARQAKRDAKRCRIRPVGQPGKSWFLT